MNKTTVLYLVWLCVLLPTGVWSQKMGYTNSSALIVDLPETQAAESRLKSLQESLANSLKTKEVALQNRYNDYFRQIEERTLSGEQDILMKQELQKEEKVLQELASTYEKQIITEREGLLNPILEKVQRAIDQVAKENSYGIIIDVSVLNVLLHADEASDITPQVKAILGI